MFAFNWSQYSVKLIVRVHLVSIGPKIESVTLYCSAELNTFARVYSSTIIDALSKVKKWQRKLLSSCYIVESKVVIFKNKLLDSRFLNSRRLCVSWILVSWWYDVIWIHAKDHRNLNHLYHLNTHLTRKRLIPVRRELESHQWLPLFPWARNVTLIESLLIVLVASKSSCLDSLVLCTCL